MKLNYAWIFIPLVALLGYYYFFVLEKNKPDGPSDAGTSITVDTGNMNLLELRSGEDVVRLTRESDRWMMTSPFNTPADNEKVGKLISEIGGLKIGRSLGTLSESGKSEYGLDNPTYRLSIFDHDGKILNELSIGNENPSGDASYFSQGDGNLYLVNSNDIKFLNVDASELRSKIVMDIAPGQVDYFEFSANDVEFSIRYTNNMWRTEGQDPVRVSESWVDGFLTLFMRARAEKFVKSVDVPDLLPFNGGVRVKRNDGTEHTIQFYGVDKAQGVLAKCSNLKEPFFTEFRIEQYLNVTVDDIREYHMLITSRDLVQSVVFREVDGQNVNFEKSDSGYTILKPPGMGNPGKAAFDSFFDAVLEISADKYIESPPTPADAKLDPYWIKIEVKVKNLADNLNLYIGKETEGGYYVSPDGGLEVYVMSADKVNHIIEATNRLRGM